MVLLPFRRRGQQSKALGGEATDPVENRYTKDHEWLRLDGGDRATVGITDYAQFQLGDMVLLRLPPVGSHFAQYEKFGEVESVKAVADLFSPVSGDVVAVNTALAERPELANKDPYGEGWLIRLQLTDEGRCPEPDEGELASLMDHRQYGEYVASLTRVPGG